MIMARQSIVEKLNTQTQFELTHDELEFIIENWITIHSQNLSKVGLNIDTTAPDVYASVTLNKDSIFKHF